jgi:allophanate hydrolase subunit 2
VGLCPGGAMDPVAPLANALVDNADDEAHHPRPTHFG